MAKPARSVKRAKPAKRSPKVAPEATPSFDEVMTLARRWYYTEIKSLADDAIIRLLWGTLTDESNRREWLATDVDQTTDGHEYVISTAKAAMVCAASDNDGAYEDSVGEKPPTVEAQACYAMRTDVWQVLEARSDEWIPKDPDE